MHPSAMKLSRQWALLRQNSEQLRQKCEQIEKKMADLEPHIEASSDWPFLCESFQEIDSSIRELEAYILCLSSENTEDQAIASFEAAIKEIRAKFIILIALWQNQLKKLSLEEVNVKIQDSSLSEFRLFIQETADQAHNRLDFDKERMLQTLAIDGYHGWQEMYYSLASTLSVPDPDQEGIELSIGQGENKLLSIYDNEKRRLFFHQWEDQWKARERQFALILNHLSGYRIQAYRLRKWDDILTESLEENRIQRQTLDLMWQAVASASQHFEAYFQARARCLQLKKLSWFDTAISLCDFDLGIRTFEEAVDFIEHSFKVFHKGMGAFVRDAVQKGWIESEDRPHKRSGAFCVMFPESKESRIFMTYSNNFSNLLTLAHELGHAYHDHILQSRPGLQQKVPMNVAESASTLAEIIIVEALLKRGSPEQKLFLLDAKIQRSMQYLMNIRARFLFEMRFYQRRAEGALSPEELCNFMEEAQKEAFCNGLDRWHPYFWCSKLHFYFTENPFYNYPYTFGYLLSHCLHRQAKKEPSAFPMKYDAFLADSGGMKVEQLITKHLSSDATTLAFWIEAIEGLGLEENIKEFCQLSGLL
jgi:oligoendopeptidase F